MEMFPDLGVDHVKFTSLNTNQCVAACYLADWKFITVTPFMES